jgi:GT2 family glycosyltransferase
VVRSCLRPKRAMRRTPIQARNTAVRYPVDKADGEFNQPATLGPLGLGTPPPLVSRPKLPPIPAVVPNWLVSVVVPTYNRSEMLERVLFSLWRQNDDNYEVLVCNDDDADKYKATEDVVKDFERRGMNILHFYTGQFKRGQGWSVETYPYNVGIRHAKGEIILLNSGDVLSVTNTIHEHRTEHARQTNLGVVSTVHAITVAVQNDIETYNWRTNPFSLLFRGSCYKMFTGQGASYTAAYAFEDACVPYHFQMSIRKNVLHEIRGFDEDYYGRMQCGDDDLADRLRRFGITFCWPYHILAIHQCHGSPESIACAKEAMVNPKISGFSLFHSVRRHQGIVRNAKHEWGQYPRDMVKLPVMSGVV